MINEMYNEMFKGDGEKVEEKPVEEIRIFASKENQNCLKPLRKTVEQKHKLQVEDV